jgi:23S rRNA (adenine2503-C2)-methyltransferase
VRVIAEFGREELATVFVAEAGNGSSRLIEFVESVQPPIPREEKWVLIVSTLLGCPVGCAICDAGGWYEGKLGPGEILGQILYMVDRRFPGRKVPVPKFKIQFARMGEPAFNPAVNEVLRRLPQELDAPGLLPSVSSVAPAGSEDFFEELLRVKDALYGGGRFQLQFSIHSTDRKVRSSLIPAAGLPFEWMASFGRRFRREGDQMVTLNFAAARGVSVDAAEVRALFQPDTFLIKLTPVNPTLRAGGGGIESAIDPERPETGSYLKEAFEREGFRVILSIGEAEENAIGSNCGMFVSAVRGEVGTRGVSDVCKERGIRGGYRTIRTARTGAQDQ